jgi:hypothetical protein
MPDKPDHVRRGLVTGAPILGVASLLLTEDAPGAETPQPLDDDPRKPTFRDTDHVKTFYRLARG